MFSKLKLWILLKSELKVCVCELTLKLMCRMSTSNKASMTKGDDKVVRPPVIRVYQRRPKVRVIDPRIIAALRARGYPLRTGRIVEARRDFPVGLRDAEPNPPRNTGSEEEEDPVEEEVDEKLSEIPSAPNEIKDFPSTSRGASVQEPRETIVYVRRRKRANP